MPRELLTFLAARRRFRDLCRPESMRVNRRLALLGFLCLDACGGDSVAPPPPPNSWVQRASVPGGGVSGASSFVIDGRIYIANGFRNGERSEEHTSELQSHSDLVCRLLLEKKKSSRQNT